MMHVAHAVVRIGTGLLFVEHGLQKLFGLLGGIDGRGATVSLMSQLGVAGVLELVGGLLIIVGLFTRPVAIVLILEMIVAFSIAHLPRGGAPVQNGGELALLYALIFLFLATHGPGPYSVDERLGTRVRA
jgi:putative oxidoreductase